LVNFKEVSRERSLLSRQNLQKERKTSVLASKDKESQAWKRVHGINGRHFKVEKAGKAH